VWRYTLVHCAVLSGARWCVPGGLGCGRSTSPPARGQHSSGAPHSGPAGTRYGCGHGGDDRTCPFLAGNHRAWCPPNRWQL